MSYQNILNALWGLQWFKVEYSKGHEMTTFEPPVCLEVYQKPAYNGKIDFTCEHEWRLAVCIKIDRNELNNSNNVMFVTGKDRSKRIAKHIDINVKDLTPEILQSYGENGPEEAPLWIETIIVNHSEGFRKCVNLYEE